MAFEFTPALRSEYENLFNTCDILPGKLAEADNLTTKINNNRPRYEKVASALHIPWFFVGAVHCMEASLSFTAHLHNGDPLTARTVHVPAGRPLTWGPPSDWESSAEDALRMRRLDQVTDWSMPGVLYQLEGYNGFGYRRLHPDVLTPYLWSYSNHYTSGKYVADGTFDPDAVSKQCGCAVLLRRMAEKGMISFDAQGNPQAAPATAATGAAAVGNTAAALGPLVTFSNTQESDVAKKLQAALNTLPGIFLLVDGVPGTKTSDAFRTATGHFLMGDPRAGSANANVLSQAAGT